MAQRNSDNTRIVNDAAGGFSFPLNASFATPWIKVQDFDRYSFTFVTDAGTAAGTLTLRVSDFGFGSPDRTKRIPSRGDEPTAAQSLALVGSGAPTATVAAASTAYRVWDVNLSYTWVQLTFTDTSGGANTGNATIALTTITGSKN